MHRKAQGAMTLTVALLTGLLAFALCSCQGRATAAQTAEPQTDAEELPQIKIGTNFLDPLFYVGRDGEYTGIDAELAKEACRRAGLAPVFVDVRWSERYESLDSNDVDCIWSGFAIDGRENDYLWTDSYFVADIAMLVQANSPCTSVESFGGPRGIAVRAGSIAEQLLLSGACGIPGTITINAYGSSEMAETSLVKGFSDACVGYKVVLDQLANKYPGSYRFLSEDLATVKLGVAFKRGYTGPYYRKINDALASMKRDGTIDRIVQEFTSNSTGDANEQ